jgi:hypothetical protein
LLKGASIDVERWEQTMRNRMTGWGALATMVLAMSCSEDGGQGNSAPRNEAGSSNEPDAGGSGPRPDGGGPEPDAEGGSGGSGEEPPPPSTALLRRASDCADLSSALRAEIRARIEHQLETGGNAGSGGGTGFGGSSGVGGSPSGTGGTFSAGGTGVGTGGSWNGTGGGAGASSGSGAGGSGQDPGGPIFTGTNTQIPGVDETDFVKTDGQNFYVVDGNTLHVARGYPVEETSLLDSLEIEGSATEIFLADGPDPLDPTSVRIVVYSVPPTADVADDEHPGPFTKLSVIAFSGGELSIESELYFEGNFVSARRQADHVRTVLTLFRSLPEFHTYPTDAERLKAELLVLEQIQDEGKSVGDFSADELDELIREKLADILLEENVALIDGLDAADFVPRAYRRNGDEYEDVSIDCDDVYIPPAETMDLGVTYVPQVDLGALSDEPSGAALLGSTSVMYENTSVTIMASPPSYAGSDPETYLHVFEIGEEPLAYQSSGVVSGIVTKQFAIDEQNGVVRVVTTDGLRKNHLLSLRATDTDLEVIGDSGVFGEDEDLYAVRFVGDTGYVVTFRQIDPLFVFDLSDPEHPEKLAELEMPGFSEYMHPLGDDHLLTIGQSGNWTTMLRLFDVSDRAAPELTFSHEFDYGLTSAANLDHRAFTFFADRNLLAIPFSGWDYDTYASINRISVLGVSVQDGFSEVGTLDGSALLSEVQALSCSWDAEYRSRLERAAFIGDVVYGAARSGIVSGSVDDLAAEPTVLAFPQTCDNGGTGGTAGTGAGGSSAGTGSSGTGSGSGGISSTGGWTGTGGSTGGISGSAGTVGTGGAPGSGGTG